jgi:signal transduction histidine kinase
MQIPQKSEELIAANKELQLQNEEKEKRAAELILANIELAFQNQEKENRAAELVIANKELIFQNKERENRAAELILANIELAFQNEEKEKRAAELIILNQELTYQNEVKDKFAFELKQAYKKIKKADEYLKEHTKSLEQMMFMTSHRVRRPVANILGLTSIIGNFMNSPIQLKRLVKYIEVSATSLDMFVTEFTLFIGELEKKGIAASDSTGGDIDGLDVKQPVA